MKTLETLYQEVLASEELKRAFSEAVNENRVEAFLKENGCEAGAEALEAFLMEKQEKQGELADEELDNVAGGGCTDKPASVRILSGSSVPEITEMKVIVRRCIVRKTT